MEKKEILLRIRLTLISFTLENFLFGSFNGSNTASVADENAWKEVFSLEGK